MNFQKLGPESMKEPSSKNYPLFPDVGVVNLLAERWGGPWRSRHQILTRLSKFFNIVWSNPAPLVRKSLLSFSAGGPQIKSQMEGGGGISFYHPEWWLPTIGRPKILSKLTMQERLRRARKILEEKKCKKFILLIWRPEYEPALDLIDYDVSAYRIDDEYTFSEKEQAVGVQEKRLIMKVNQVLIHSPGLMEKKGHLNPQTRLSPNGVDYHMYSTPQEAPADLKSIPSPRIGYVGVLKKQLNLPLLYNLVKRHPEWSFVFVGPKGNLGEHRELLEELSFLPNAYLLGDRPVSALPSYTQHLDVGLLCYKINDYTQYIYPLKLHEYLAAGLPIIGSPIRSLQEFGHLIQFARTPDEWSQAISDALHPNMHSQERMDARQAVARQYDWGKLTQNLAACLCEHLGQSYVDQFESTFQTNDDY